MGNLQREVWEGWTPQDFINSLADEMRMIMTGESFTRPFQTAQEMKDWIRCNQPYYKKSIPEVDNYFVTFYWHRLK